MLARIRAGTTVGLDAVGVAVEVDVSNGLPGITMVGLPDATVRESRDRVRSAIRNSGFPFPRSRVTVSLMPSDLRKVGALFDLPIALGVLAAGGVLPHHGASRFTIVGGLSLDGGLTPMPGVLPLAAAARGQALMFPLQNLPEASIVEGVQLFPVRSLMEAAQTLVAARPTPAARVAPQQGEDGPILEDLADVRGQLVARRALEIAAAGGHHLLLGGPPGAGKTMLARRLPGLLPPPSFDEALSVTTIYSVAGLLPTGSGLIRRRPFRAPHHTSSEIALVGGGAQPRPGELTLAHTGVLFLDEVPEFGRRVLETLRQPLESGIIHIARAARSATFPARVLLVGAMNPCPCGYAGQAFPQCRCTPRVVDQYRQRLSGPLRDRFDLSVEVAPVPWQELSGSAGPENSAAVRARVILARSLQMQRQGCLNGTMEGAELRRHAALSPDTAALLGRRAEALGLSARGVHRVLRVARTIADLAGQEGLAAAHLAEALQFRLPGSADRHHVPDAV